MTDEQLRRYLGAVEAVRAVRAGAVDPELRHKIAEELGISADDLAAARAEGEADLTRGEGFVRHGMWDEAMAALGEADSLLPDDARVVGLLARAYWGRRDRARARALARRWLELDPSNEGAFALLREIDARHRRRVTIAGAGVAALAAVAAGLTYVSLPGAPRCPDGAQYCTLPADLRVAGSLGDGVVFAPATLEVGPRAVRLQVSGRLTHAGGTELELYRLRMKLLDTDREQVGALAIDAQPSFAPALRPGDSRAFYLSERVPPATRSVAISAGERRAAPAPSAYGPGEAVVPVFEPAAPAHVALRAAYRAREVRRYGGKTAIEGVLEVENAGTGVVRELEIELRAFDAAGRALDEPSRETLAYGHMLPMAPGERRTVRTFLYVTGDVASEKLVVTKVR